MLYICDSAFGWSICHCQYISIFLLVGNWWNTEVLFSKAAIGKESESHLVQTIWPIISTLWWHPGESKSFRVRRGGQCCVVFDWTRLSNKCSGIVNSYFSVQCISYLMYNTVLLLKCKHVYVAIGDALGLRLKFSQKKWSTV